uniref:rRNA-processing protein UTP23 homolog n=1 Tax=Phallusia mammillata TaxID=59560 RepID=A0A6F9DX13_9ASCI|nr:rRNA-processing protein UTP23 homolog [Phallusia mammillata]
MKIKRQKQARHLLSMYKNSFRIQEPFQVLIDGTFAQAAYKNKVFIEDQLSKYLSCSLRCFTTKCVLAELSLLGSEMRGAKAIIQKFQTKPCSHDDSPTSAVKCLKSLIGDKNEHGYFIATQDANLTKLARSIPGIPVLYIYQMSIILDKPSKATSNFVKDLSSDKIRMPAEQKASLLAMKKEANIIIPQKRKPVKRKGPKGPNPLSVKKKKKKGN